MGINGKRQQNHRQMPSKLVTGETPSRRNPHSKPCTWDVQTHPALRASPWPSLDSFQQLQVLLMFGPRAGGSFAGGVSPEQDRGAESLLPCCPHWEVSPGYRMCSGQRCLPCTALLDGCWKAQPGPNTCIGVREVKIPGMWHKETGMVWKQLPGRECEELSLSSIREQSER